MRLCDYDLTLESGNFAKDLAIVWGILTTNERDYLVDNAVLYRYEFGERLNMEMFSSEALCFVCSGRVLTYMHTTEGRRLKMLEREAGSLLLKIGEGDLTEDIFIEDVAGEDAVVAVVPAEAFERLRAAHAELRQLQTEATQQYLSKLTTLTYEVAFYPLKERLLRKLEEIGRKSGNKPIEITHEGLASELGTSREVVSRLLKQLSNEGLVQLKRKSILLRNNHMK